MIAETELPECFDEVLIVEMADEVDWREEQWDWLRRRLPHPGVEKKVCVAEVCRAYEEATGTWTGRD